jgi:hypothetical protein
MVPVGYMAKRVAKKPEGFTAPQVIDIYSVSACISENFADYIHYWKHNGYWFFDSPELSRSLAREHSIDLEGTSLFYYEAHELEFNGGNWNAYGPEPSFPTNVAAPSNKQLEGFDVVSFYVRSSPECSPLTCNSMAEQLPVNAHGLFASFREAETHVTNGAFSDCEPGPYRIFSVYSVAWT